jgi:hypothetical protein
LSLALVVGFNGGGPATPHGVKYFTGKITEIARGSEMEPGKRENFYMLRLDEAPNTTFRLSPKDAVRFGVIEAAGPAAVVTPKMSKGLGWRVKLTCNAPPTGSLKAPVYQVTSLERLGD